MPIILPSDFVTQPQGELLAGRPIRSQQVGRVIENHHLAYAHQTAFASAWDFDFSTREGGFSQENFSTSQPNLPDLNSYQPMIDLSRGGSDELLAASNPPAVGLSVYAFGRAFELRTHVWSMADNSLIDSFDIISTSDSYEWISPPPSLFFELSEFEDGAGDLWPAALTFEARYEFVSGTVQGEILRIQPVEFALNDADQLP